MRKYDLVIANQGGVDDYTDDRKSIHSVSPIVALLGLCVIFSLFGVVFFVDSLLPTALSVQDEIKYPNAFISERARADLKVLTDLGPRVAGSYENEVLAVDFLKREIGNIQHFAHIEQKIEFDVQHVSGSYFLGYKPHGAFNAYGNVQNIVVKLQGKGNNSIMLNAHFDTVPTSPGGSDDGIMCATMLEILRKLSRSAERLQHTIIFLFNGAEETPLQASHGFITQHPWAKDVKIMVNLEAAGAGSKEILFQTGPDHPWLINYYKNVPHPYGQAAGEEIFQSNIIPSDTDFRVFRDFGNIFGYDFAFARNGYRYHTKYDDFENIPKGSYQHVGDNILALVRNLGNAPELDNTEESSNTKIVYYDYLGLFMISYNLTIAYIINLLVVVLSVASAIRAFYRFGGNFKLRTALCLGTTFASIFAGWIFGLLFVVVLAFLLDGIHYSMSWYGNPWLVFGLFCVPTFLAMLSVFSVLKTFKKIFRHLSISSLCQVEAHATRLVWTLLLFVGTILKIRGSYVLLIPVLFNTVGFGVIQIFKWEYSVRKWQVVYLLSTILPTLFNYYMAIAVLSLFIPITGRSGPDKNFDLLIGVLSCLLTILTATFYAPLIILVRKSWIVLTVLAGVFLVFFIIVFTPLGFPYTGNHKSPAPQRYWIYHTSRNFYDDAGRRYNHDSGFFLMNMDRNSPRAVTKYVREIGIASKIEDFCEKYPFCAFPLAHSRMTEVVARSTWIPAEDPVIQEPISMKLLSKENIGDNLYRFNFELNGPDHASVYFSLREHCKLNATSLSDEIPKSYSSWKKQPTYFLKYGWSKVKTALQFHLDIEVPENWSGPTLDVVASGQNVHDKSNNNTDQYKQFLNQFPDWADLMTGLATVNVYMY